MACKRKLVFGSDDEDSRGKEEAHLDLERSIKELYKEQAADGDHHQGHPVIPAVQKVELISKLEETRQEEASRKRMARRIAWREEVRKEIERRAEFKEIMESLPLEDVEAEEKPMMSRMSVEWWVAFKSERAGFLFPPAFEVMATVLDLADRRHFDEDFNLRIRTTTILVYRLVCKSVKESVDAILSSEQFLSRTEIIEPFFYIPMQYCRTMPISEFTDLEKTTRFTKEFSQAVVNPFYTRTIYISPPSELICSPEFLNEIEIILRRWGKELWSAALYLEAEPTSTYDLLVSWLKLMPNLRVLMTVFGKQKSDYAELMEHIGKNSLPDMPHLTRLTIDSSEPSPITHALLSNYNSTLQRIESDFNSEWDRIQIEDTVSNCPPPATVEGSFPALREMHVSYRNLGSVADVGKIITNFNNWRLPLKRLELRLHNNGIEAKGYGPLFELNNGALASKGVFLEMPQLEELTLILYFRFNLRTLDFLLPCKSLKVLTVRNIQAERNVKHRRNLEEPPEEDKGIFQFTMDPADKDLIYRSPIWKLLPELKLIVLKTVSIKTYGKFQKARRKQNMTVGSPETRNYTRERYLQHNKELESGRSKL